jgi:hypothetical protein
MTTALTFDPKELEAKVKAMYRSVAENPHGEFHFEMGAFPAMKKEGWLIFAPFQAVDK